MKVFSGPSAPAALSGGLKSLIDDCNHTHQVTEPFFELLEEIKNNNILISEQHYMTYDI